jgi:hypothetical protein
MATYYLVQNDAKQDMFVSLKNADGTVIDLTDATSVTFHCGFEGDKPGVLVSGLCSIVTPATGRVKYTWLAANTAVLSPSVSYDAEFEILWPTAIIRTVPAKAGGFKVVVKGEVG